MSARRWRWSWPKPRSRRSTPPRRSTCDYEELPFVARRRSRARAGRDQRVGRGAGQCSWSRRSSAMRRRPMRAFAARIMSSASTITFGRVTAVAIEPRAALGRHTTPRPGVTRSMRRHRRRGAAEARARQRARHPARQSSASSPPMSAAISARRTGLMSNTRWCCGRRGGCRPAGQIHRRRAARRSSPTIRAAIR